MLSIITGTLNRKKYLERVVKNTVLSYDRLELVLVDGGSSDGTQDYIKGLNHPRIKLIEYGQRSTYSHFMNLAVKNSSYEYVCQWNDDVVLLNPWEDVISTITNETFDAFNFSWIRLSGNSVEDFDRLDKLDSNYHTANPLKALNVAPLENCRYDTCMNYGIYNKKVFREIGLYNPQFPFYCCDWDMMERTTAFGYKIKQCDQIVVASFEPPKSDLSFFNKIVIKGSVKENVDTIYANKQLPEGVEKLQ